jgi:FtsP/CotA-like multicopper oxidase with cupredoxin domain
MMRVTARAWRRKAVAAPLTLIALLANTPHARETLPWEEIDTGGLTELRSRDGILSVTLHAAPQTVAIGGASFPGAAYNGQYAGPVLHVRPGDLVHIRLVNGLADPTNLHFHGLRISPLGRGDNMHVVVPSGGTRDYLFRIAANHPPGLFWYHDHIHTLSEQHVMAGLSGTLLIDGFSRDITGLAGTAQKLLVLKDYTAPNCQGAVLKTALHCRVMSINGQASWAGTMRPGETQLWRIANEGANLITHLSLPGLQFRIIGRDGTPTTAPEDATVLDVMPASRMDVLVTAGAAGTFKLAALHVLTDAGEQFSANRDMGAVTVAGPPAAPAASPGFPAQIDLRKLGIDARRVVTFTEDEAAGKYFIDGKLFDHNRIDVRVKLGNLEEWTIRNQTQDFHEFHIHQMGFQVTEINGVAQPFTGYVDDAKVPEMGEIKVILPFTDPVILGSFMFHCHVLKHEDGGMMAQIEVYRDGAPAHTALCQFPQK